MLNVGFDRNMSIAAGMERASIKHYGYPQVAAIATCCGRNAHGSCSSTSVTPFDLGHHPWITTDSYDSTTLRTDT
jgi:hypothetical protein